MSIIEAILARPARALRTAAFAAAALVLPALPASAQIEIGSLGLTVTTTPSITSDYLFRGISQTRNNWAYQGTVDVQHESGVYVGAFLSNAKFLASPYNDTRQELDLLAGYRFTLADINFDIGYIAYLYPGQSKPDGTQRNEYQEIAFKANYAIDPLKLYASYYYSPNYFGRSGTGHYIEGGVDISLPLDLTLAGRVGYQYIQNNPRFGTPDYVWYSIGISREIYWGVTASIACVNTNIKRNECLVSDRSAGGQRACDDRFLFTLSKVF